MSEREKDQKKGRPGEAARPGPAKPAGGGVSSNQLLSLQALAGNQAVTAASSVERMQPRYTRICHPADQ